MPHIEICVIPLKQYLRQIYTWSAYIKEVSNRWSCLCFKKLEKITNETKKEKKNINRLKVSKEKYKDTNIKVEDNKIKQRKQ